MASRNNPFINWLNMSFDTFNLLHRWFGRIVVLESLTHTFAWAANTIHTKGWGAVMPTIHKSPFMMYGFIVSFAMFLREFCSLRDSLQACHSQENLLKRNVIGNYRIPRPRGSGEFCLSPRFLRNFQASSYCSCYSRPCWSVLPLKAGGSSTSQACLCGYRHLGLRACFEGG